MAARGVARSGGSDCFVTGVSAVTPLGWTLRSTWDGILEGRSGVSRVQRFPTYDASCRVAGCVPCTERADVAERSLAEEFAVAALDVARSNSGLDDCAPEVLLVANHGERRMLDGSRSSRVNGVKELANALAARVQASRSLAIYGACAGSLQAVGIGKHLIETGAADVVVAGGADCLIREFDFFSICSLFVMTSRDCPPEEASCPFDDRRDGFVLSEGASFFVLESAASVERRGAEPLAIASGFGLRQNAYHMFAPPPDGLGPAGAMADALADARLDPADIDFVSAHGTSTRDNDVSETIAIRTVLGSAADQLPVSSQKSQLGHMMAACGSTEAALCVEMLRNQLILPTANLDEPDPRCDLDFVPNVAREARLRRVLTNSFGFGGHSSSLVLEAV